MRFQHNSMARLRDGREVTVRFKVPEDLEAWRRFIAIVPDGSGHAPETDLDLGDLGTPYHRHEENYLIAEVGGEIVGAMFLFPHDPDLGYHREHAVEFRIDVLPGWRRQGVGDAMMEGLLSWARQQGDVNRLEAMFLGWNEPARAFLAKHEFEEEGRRARAWKVRVADGSVDYDDIIHLGRWVGD